MTTGTNWSVCPTDATFAAYANHDQAQQDAWRAQYAAASQAAFNASIAQAAQAVVIAGIQAAAADNAADQQWNIANRQMTIAEDEYERYTAHFICNEHLLADAACDIADYVPDYETKANRATVDVRRQFTVARKQLERTRSRYCMADFDRSTCDLAAKEARAVIAVKDASYRAEEARADALDDRRFNRAVQVANLGRNIQAQQVQTYASGAEYANQAIGTKLNGINNFLGALSGGISGIIQAKLSTTITPSPFANSGFVSNAYAGTNTGYNTANGGPAPLGQFAGQNINSGGLY